MNIWTSIGLCLFGVGLGAFLTMLSFGGQVRDLKQKIAFIRELTSDSDLGTATPIQ